MAWLLLWHPHACADSSRRQQVYEGASIADAILADRKSIWNRNDTLVQAIQITKNDAMKLKRKDG